MLILQLILKKVKKNIELKIFIIKGDLDKLLKLVNIEMQKK